MCVYALKFTSRTYIKFVEFEDDQYKNNFINSLPFEVLKISIKYLVSIAMF